MTLEDSELASKLLSHSGGEPAKAERLSVSSTLEVDFLHFENMPYEGVNSVVTNGVNTAEPSVQHEFVMSFSVNSLLDGVDITALIATYLQLHYLGNASNVGSGAYLRVPNILIDRYDFEGLYTTGACYFNDDLAKGDSYKLLWLIPVYDNELRFLEEHGPNKFEDKLEQYDPDLCDLKRRPLKL